MPRAAVVVAVVLVCLQPVARADPFAINAVIGDASAPQPIEDETSRIRTHLTYVLAMLRDADTGALTPEERTARTSALASLAGYIERGQFPHRTADPYVGRRPRFIDERGVPCAVAHLLLDSGATELARSLATDHEYAYVPDMHVPALHAWAVAHGLSIVELATIQPTYGPDFIDEDRMRDLVERSKDHLVITCAREGTPVEQIELHLVGDKKGPKSATATQRGRFARCFERYLSKPMRGDPQHGLIATPFDFTMTVALKQPQQLLTEWLGYVRPHCVPKPGAIPTEATIEVTTTATGQSLSVVTSPSNAEVATCIADDQREVMKRFDGIAGLTVRKTVPVPPRFEAAAFAREVQMNAYGIARQCRPAAVAIGRKVTVTVSAKIDDKELAVSVNSKNDAFTTCIATKLREHLHSVFSGHRKRDDRTTERYFRIDANVSASHAFELPPGP